MKKKKKRPFDFIPHEVLCPDEIIDWISFSLSVAHTTQHLHENYTEVCVVRSPSYWHTSHFDTLIHKIHNSIGRFIGEKKEEKFFSNTKTIKCDLQ